MIIDALIRFYTNSTFLRIFDVLYTTYPIWLPIVLTAGFWKAWTVYTYTQFILSQSHTLLEVKLPQEVMKPPMAMELVLTAMHLTAGETTVIDRYWYGKRRTWFSLEYVSSGGDVHFYIWTRSFFKNIVENALYSQYPGIEISEVEDYAVGVRYDKEKMAVWGCEYRLRNADPYPIKTYVDFGLDQTQTKEEQKVDPLTPTVEWLGAVHPEGQVWIQIMIQTHRNDKRQRGTWFGRTDWREEARAECDKILRRDPKTKGSRQVTSTGFPVIPSFTEQERRLAEAIQRSIAKPAFNVGIRGIYIADKDKFNGINVIGLIYAFKQFGSPESNEFSVTRWHTVFDWPWQDFRKIRYNRMAYKLIEYYKRRAYFHPPYKQQPFILTAEELATIFHPIGAVLTTPTVERIMSKKAEPPSNLPT